MPRNMSDEPRRSGRATKGQHKNASSSPAPNAKPGKGNKPKSSKKSERESELQRHHEGADDEEEEEEEEVIRCICGNDNPKDKRAFIGCDACTVWQHNVCMGVHDDEDDVPEHYFCEECRPQEHLETVQAIRRGEKIWETRNKIFNNEKKMSKSRKSKAKNGEDFRPGWLKKDVLPEPADLHPDHEPEAEQETKDEKETTETQEPQETQETPTVTTSVEVASGSAPSHANGNDSSPEAGNKRKRNVVKHDETTPDESSTRPSRQEKRRKSSAAPGKAPPASNAPTADPNTALVSINELPQNRRRAAQALAEIITTAVRDRVKSDFKIPKGESAESLGTQHGARIEYAAHMNYEGDLQAYNTQCRALFANLKKNQVLVQRLLNGSLSADEISIMSSSDMASEDLQRQRAEMKEMLDRQATVDQPEGPRYAQDHKGYHLIEGGATTAPSVQAADPKPVAQSASPPQTAKVPLAVDTSKQPITDRRSSSQQFDMNNIWAKTANSPTLPAGQGGPARPAQASSRRRSSVHRPQAPQNGAKDDPDVDRMLQDNDDADPHTEGGGSAVVWRGKVVQTSEDSAPVVNARFVAGRDLQPATLWQNLLPRTLSIDGRLQITKAEDYLCGLRWSSSSDVSVLQLTPGENVEAFNSVFDYFHSRERYAVVEKDKPAMVKDLYIIPVESGQALPGHVEMLEHCTLSKPVQERTMLATLIIARAPDSPVKDAGPQQASANGHLPPHVRQSIGGPAGSPLNAQHSSFSPPNPVQAQSAYGGAPAFPPNPYGPQAQHHTPPMPSAQQQPHANPLVSQILGDLQYAPTAQLIFNSAPNISTDQLQNLRAILEEDVNARTDLEALTRRLYAGGR
ncbi:putative histone deacetylase complex subunit cti6 [Cercospora zeina]